MRLCMQAIHHNCMVRNIWMGDCVFVDHKCNEMHLGYISFVCIRFRVLNTIHWYLMLTHMGCASAVIILMVIISRCTFSGMQSKVDAADAGEAFGDGGHLLVLLTLCGDSVYRAAPLMRDWGVFCHLPSETSLNNIAPWRLINTDRLTAPLLPTRRLCPDRARQTSNTLMSSS